MPLLESRCRACGCGLTVHQQVRGICNNPECRRKDVGFQMAKRRAAVLREIERLVPKDWPQKWPIVPLPSNEHRLIPADSDRRERHRQYLLKIVRQARENKDEGDEAETQAPTNDIAPGEELPVFGYACRLCGGECCSTGGDTAWLESATIRRVLSTKALGIKSNLDDREIVEAYLAYFPQSSFENSCIYHAAGGCTLPRKIRSNVCNQYLCIGLSELVSAWRECRNPFVVAKISGMQIKHIALINDNKKVIDCAPLNRTTQTHT